MVGQNITVISSVTLFFLNTFIRCPWKTILEHWPLTDFVGSKFQVLVFACRVYHLSAAFVRKGQVLEVKGDLLACYKGYHGFHMT